MEQIFAGEIETGDVLVDIGCGYGRVINWWLDHYPDHQMIGIELDEGVAGDAQTRLGKYPNVEIIQGDAIANLPENGTVFYMYNPFGAEIVADLKARFDRLFAGKKSVKIIYYNCKHLEEFTADPHWTVEEKPLNSHPAAPYSPLAILKRR